MSDMAFYRELEQVAENRHDQQLAKDLKRALSESFCTAKKSGAYVYLLIDPQISKNLPHVYASSSSMNIATFFKLFLRSIFYVGKASSFYRLESHLAEAKRVYRTTQIQQVDYPSKLRFYNVMVAGLIVWWFHVHSFVAFRLLKKFVEYVRSGIVIMASFSVL